jgi:hypothetical protein
MEETMAKSVKKVVVQKIGIVTDELFILATPHRFNAKQLTLIKGTHTFGSLAAYGQGAQAAAKALYSFLYENQEDIEQMSWTEFAEAVEALQLPGVVRSF